MSVLSKGKLVLVVGLIAGLLPIQGRADPQKLSELSLAAYHRDGGDVVIDTTGKAKLRISFDLAQMVRVQVSPTGDFTANPSIAVVEQTWPAVSTQVSNTSGFLTIRSSDMAVRISDSGLRVAVYGEGGKELLTGDAADGGTRWDASTGSVGQSTAIASDERLYGLGEDNANGGTLDRRGTVCDLWTGQQIRSGNVTADDPVPFYLSTGHEGHGYGVFVDNGWRLRFDMGKTQPDRLDWSAPGGPIDYYVMDGPSFKSIIDHYTQLTGRPAMLPLWAFGYWQSKCAYQNFPEMQGIVNKLRVDGIPVDVMVIDYSWPAHFIDFTWGKSWTTADATPAQSLAKLHADGIHIVQSTDGPMIRKDSPNFQSGWDAGIFATDGHGAPVTAGYYGGELMDFTNPKMSSWLWPQLKPLWKDGIDGWWLDLIEPEGDADQTVFSAGTRQVLHNSFSTRVIRNYYDFQKSVTPNGRPVLLGRAGTAGEQRYGGILWTGDTNSDWPTFRAQIPEAQNDGLSGLPWWTNDSGGFLSGFYKNDQFGAHAQLYARWMEFSAFAPVARAHKAGPSAPFEYGPVAIAAAHKYLGLRYRLLPYIYTNAYVTHVTGLPLLRPLVLEYQDDVVAAETKDEFLLGQDLLVAPVDVEDAVTRSVYLPHGDWIGLEDGKKYVGGSTTTVSAPVDCIPVFVRAGAIIPMAPANMMSSGEKPWNPITLDIYPHGDSSFTMYSDDGLTTAFEQGEYTLTSFRCQEKTGRSITFTIEESNRKFVPKIWNADFHVDSAPKSVRVDSKVIAQGTGSGTGWSYDGTRGVLEVPVTNADVVKHVVEIGL